MINVTVVKDPKGEKEKEYLQHQVDTYEGLLEYVAMMTNVDLPIEEEVSENAIA